MTPVMTVLAMWLAGAPAVWLGVVLVEVRRETVGPWRWRQVGRR